MPSEVIFGIIFVGVIVLFFVSRLLPKRQPKEKSFECARCGVFSRHTERTIEAWRNTKPKFSVQHAMLSGFNPGRRSFSVAMPVPVQAVSVSLCFLLLFRWLAIFW